MPAKLHSGQQVLALRRRHSLYIYRLEALLLSLECPLRICEREESEAKQNC